MVGFLIISRNNNLFKKFIEVKHNEWSYTVLINRAKLSKRRINKLKIQLLNLNIDTIICSNDSKSENLIKSFLADVRFKAADGKKLMKYMLPEIIEYIYSYKLQRTYEENLYVLVSNDANLDIILDICKEFKTINFVTQNIKKLKRLDKRLEKTENIVYSISENYSNALRRARIVINFDFDNDAINNFKINNSAIFINCSNNQIQINKGFKGVIIENIDITFKKNELKDNIFDQFDKSALYEGYIYNLDYRNARCKIKDDRCKTSHIIGKHGIISVNELKENIY